MNESKKSEDKERALIKIRWIIKVSNLFVRVKQEKFASLLKFRHTYQRESIAKNVIIQSQKILQSKLKKSKSKFDKKKCLAFLFLSVSYYIHRTR